jgi:hypothetical protein
MVEHRSGKVSHNTFVFFRLDNNEEVSQSLSNPPVESLYLYVFVPFQETHVLMVNICIIPFSIPSHRGQLFYHTEAFYNNCCQGLDKMDLMPTIASTAQRLYDSYMRYHTWNFSIADAWLVFPVRVIILLSRPDCVLQAASRGSRGGFAGGFHLFSEISLDSQSSPRHSRS